MNSCRPFGPHWFGGTRNPDLTVGAIQLRRFAPPSSSPRSGGQKVASGETSGSIVNSKLANNQLWRGLRTRPVPGVVTMLEMIR
jgi:hypothetical protein